MAAAIAWQHSLRHNSPQRMFIRSHSTSDVPSNFPKAQTRRLSVVDEDEDVTNGESNLVTMRASFKRPRSSLVLHQQRPARETRSSVADNDAALKENNLQAVRHEPKKPRTKWAKPTPLLLEDFATPFRECIVSPFPLPKGVECIDPVDDNGMFEYWPEFIKYSRSQEQKWIYSVRRIQGQAKDLPQNRSRLMRWLLELALHFKVSQETLYHTVRIVDTTLAKRDVSSEQLQLVGITAFLIAAKLEEYHPPSINELLELTQDSYTYDDVLGMEHRLLAVVDGLTYGVEPMVFLNRFIRAAFREGDELFKHTSLFFVDVLIPSIEYSSIGSSLKAAAAVCASRQVLSTEGVEMWTPTLEYYSGYQLFDVISLALLMVKKLDVTLTNIETGVYKNTACREVVKKFSSRSHHGSVMKHLMKQKSRVEFVMKEMTDSYDTFEADEVFS